jgi:hypothetical protein
MAEFNALALVFGVQRFSFGYFGVQRFSFGRFFIKNEFIVINYLISNKFLKLIHIIGYLETNFIQKLKRWTPKNRQS